MLGFKQCRAAAAIAATLAFKASAYDIVRSYEGSTFFDRWEWFGNWDNLTLGACHATTFLGVPPRVQVHELMWAQETYGGSTSRTQ